jgi:hypothetical protein
MVVLLAGGAGAAQRVSATKWVNGMCTTLSSWRDDVSQEAKDFKSSVSSNASVSEVKDQFVQFLDDVVASTKSMLSDLRALGTPDVSQGSGIATTMRNGLTKVQQGLEDARSRAEALPTANKAKFLSEVNSIGKSLDRSSSQAGKVFDSAKKKYDTKQLDSAQKKIPACKGL